MSKQKSKKNRKEKPVEPKRAALESSLLKPQPRNVSLLRISSGLLALWLLYLLVVAVWGA